MRKLKLQMRITLDGFVADPDGKLDWMTVPLDQKVQDILYNNANTSDTILMGRKMSPGFLKYWESVDSPFGKKLVEIPKIIFSKTQKKTSGKNARMESGDLKTVVRKLKQGSGKDILTYGGANFASALIEENLVDEFCFLVVPVTLGKGLRIFGGKQKAELIESSSHNNGVVVNYYKSLKK